MASGATGVIVDVDDSTQPPVVLLNSLATTGAMWDGVVAHLGADIGTLRFDQRDRTAPFGGAPFALDDLVDDVFATMDQAGVDQAHLGGVSLGGIVALRAAAREPKRVVTVAAMCCAPRFDRLSWIARGRAVREGGTLPLLDAVMERWFTSAWRVRHREEFMRMRQMFLTTSDDGYALACDALADADVRGDLASITAPALVISGEHDPANPIADQQAIVDGIPDAVHEVVAGAAHLAPASHPAEVAELIRAHIST